MMKRDVNKSSTQARLKYDLKKYKSHISVAHKLISQFAKTCLLYSEVSYNSSFDKDSLLVYRHDAHV